MNSFKDIAYQILKEADESLHSKEITKIALKRRLLKTKGKTPEATMSAVLLRDIKLKRNKSKFIKVGPSIFAINPKYKAGKRKVKTRKIKKPLSEEFVKNSVIIWLTKKGWKILKISNLRGHGVDVKGKKGNRYFFIETKGGSEKRQGNEVRFVYGLGQVITRMKVIARNAYLYAIAAPVPVARIARKRIPWQAARKLTLSVLSVSKDGEVKEYSWQDLKRVQKK